MKYNKYSNVKVTVDGYKFDSKKELKQYQELKLLLKAGVIKELTLQPEFVLQQSFKLNGVTHRKISYVADFKYIQGKEIVVVDVKGFKTDIYRLKKKLFLKKYGEQITFIET